MIYSNNRIRVANKWKSVSIDMIYIVCLCPNLVSVLFYAITIYIYFTSNFINFYLLVNMLEYVGMVVPKFTETGAPFRQRQGIHLVYEVLGFRIAGHIL